MSNARKILFQFSGSIACYKACQVVSRLVQAGHEVQTIATRSALNFVGEATLEGLTGKKVLSEVFERGSYMDHINLVKWADLVVLAPASANTVNKLGNGIGDDLVSTLFLAHDFAKPYLLAPAMNTKMYRHPATQSSLKKLQAWGVQILETASGVLACGDIGEGKLLDPDLILAEINSALEAKSVLAPNRLNVLITSGGTREAIDGVRSITNTSTGRTGAAIADSFLMSGHNVSLLRAKGSELPAGSAKITLREYVSFRDLNQALQETLKSGQFDAVIHAAAVSDFTVKSITTDGKTMPADNDSKLASGAAMSLNLTPNPKLLPTLKALSPKPLVVVGFKLTNGASDAEIKAAVKRASAGTDLVVQNDLTQIDAISHPTKLFAGALELKTCSTKLELAKALEDFILKAASVRSQEVRA